MSDDKEYPVISDSIKVFAWQEIRMPTRKLNREMLLPDGHIAFISCHLQGENTKQDISQQRLVRFDKRFVMQSFLAAHGSLLLESFKEGDDTVSSDFDTLDSVIVSALNTFYRVYLELTEASDTEVKAIDCLRAFKNKQ